MKHRISLIIIVAAALALAACSGGKTPLDPAPGSAGPRDTAAAALGPGDVLPDGSPSDEYLAAQWEAWLADPGEPGVDYDPSLINVSYSPAALGFRSPSGVRLPESQSAAAQPNSILRREPGYEAITNAIAAAQPVTIDTQVYFGEVTLASFRVDDGADPAEVLDAIRRDYAPYIKNAYFSMLFHAEYLPSDTYISPPNGLLWSLHRMNVPEAWEFTRGASDEWVADVDTGVRLSHQDLVSQVLDPVELAAQMGPNTFFNLAANPDNNDVSDISDSGHGTFIAGVMGAQGNGGGPMVGIAFQSHVVPVKISDGDSAPDARIIAGCLLGLAAGARAINLSWGGYHNNPDMRDMVNEIYNGGGLLFGAAGNDITGDFHYPSDYQKAVSVGSTDPTERRAWFSNFSTAVDIAAPGIPLVSTGHHNDTDYHNDYLGTSFSCPMVAAAAALLWSYDPDLTNDEVRSILVSTGSPIVKYTDLTDNFPNVDPPILRMDVGAALAEVDKVKIELPIPEAVIQKGVISLEPVVRGEPDSVQCLFNDELVATLTSAPWTFEIDTTSVSFGRVPLEFVGRRAGEADVKATLHLVVDNTMGNFPVVEDFEAGRKDFVPLDLKDYTTDEAIASQGPASFYISSGDSYEGTWGMTLDDKQGSYGANERDALISRRIRLTGVSNPTMVFYHHYNIEDGGSDFDRAWVYVTTDYGETLQPAQLKTGGPAYYSGYLADWTRAEVDLSGFSGLVHVMLVLESDELKAGENDAQNAGWWVDMITVSTNYNENVPTLTGVSVNPYSLFGMVPGLAEIDITVEEAQNVATVRYVLDVVPFDDFGAEDKILDVTDPFEGLLAGLDGYQNQLANLHVRYYDSGGLPGQEIIVPVYIFNLLGDVNADNLVNAADSAAYAGMIGLKSENEGYIPLFDSDLDGEITEADAAAVGYFWGQSI